VTETLCHEELIALRAALEEVGRHPMPGLTDLGRMAFVVLLEKLTRMIDHATSPSAPQQDHTAN
jgi:hypothetical protein